MCVCVCVCGIYVCVLVWVYKLFQRPGLICCYRCVRVYVCMCVHTCVCMCVFFLYVSKENVSMCICAHIYTDIHAHIHTYILTYSKDKRHQKTDSNFELTMTISWEIRDSQQLQAEKDMRDIFMKHATIR